jgi:bifunctional DNase/RNase
MIEMHVAGIAVDAVNQAPIVILRDTHERRALPIWVGRAEANAILQALDDQKPLRPMTHDLILNSWKAWGIKLERVIIHALLDNTFYAVLVTVCGDKKQEIDCRPSDAIALALRAHAPTSDLAAKDALAPAQGEHFNSCLSALAKTLPARAEGFL